jgi:hypothetical protein
MTNVIANPSITWDLVKENPDKPWDWYNLSLNSDFVGKEEVLTKAAGRY